MQPYIRALTGIVVTLLIFTTGSVAVALDDNHDSREWKASTVRRLEDSKNDINKDHVKVSLIGKVVKKLSGDSYLFEDDSGTIHLDSDIQLPLGQVIVIHGYVSHGYHTNKVLDVYVHGWLRLHQFGQQAPELIPISQNQN